MKFDVVFVTYNSKKWIKKCLDSILNSDYDLKNISLIFYDNKSKDDTVEILNKFKEKIGNRFNDFIIVKGRKNKGFGYGNNKGAAYGKSPYVFFFNIDTEVYPDTFSKLANEIDSACDEFGLFELAQRPYEHPKYYDPISGETSWSSGACMVLKRDLFEKIGGFDTNIFMYCEDVEISWNVRRHGFKCKYLFNVPIIHYSYEKPYEFKYTQFVYGFLGNWYLRTKYGQFRNFARGVQYICQVIFKGYYLPGDQTRKVRHKIKRCLLKNLCKKFIKYAFINLTVDKKGFKPTFINKFDYEINKENAFYIKPEIKTNPLVSIIVRTCNRPDTLRECLISLRNQTYKNIEIVVVEDGAPTAEKMINKEFKDLNIVYEATGNNVGRSKVANIAMAKAKGKYFNFLDDDDLFFPEHVEILVSELEANNYDIVWDTSFETKIDVKNKSPYKYEIPEKGVFLLPNYSRKRLYQVNLYPIQTVMFSGKLFKECGGIDENIDACEDWDFWIRLSLAHRFHRVPCTTSVFRTPANNVVRKDREKFLEESLEYLEKKFETYEIKEFVSDYYKGE